MIKVGYIKKRTEYVCVEIYLLIFVAGLPSRCSDVNSMYLSSTEPPAAAEWACLLRPLRGREPEGIWNLLSIVREMLKRRDSNAAPLLEILTEQCLTYEQVTHTLHTYLFTHDRTEVTVLSSDHWLVVQRAYIGIPQQCQRAHGAQQWAVGGGRPRLRQHV